MARDFPCDLPHPACCRERVERSRSHGEGSAREGEVLAMAVPKRWAAGVAMTALLFGAAGCGSTETKQSKPPVTSTTPRSVAGAQAMGPQGTSSEAHLAMVQQVMGMLEQATTSPGGQPKAPSSEEIRAALQSQMDQMLNPARNK